MGDLLDFDKISAGPCKFSKPGYLCNTKRNKLRIPLQREPDKFPVLFSGIGGTIAGEDIT